MVQITLGNLERNKELLNQFIEENTHSMIQDCVRNFKNINEEDAKDLVQNALLKLIEIVNGRKVQKKDTPAIAWIHQELRWRCIDLMREKERGEKIMDIFPFHPIPIEDEVIQREIYKFLRECIEKRMKGRRREIFKLYLEGYIAVDIAQKFGVSRAFISKETKIGCHNLRQWLKQRGFD